MNETPISKPMIDTNRANGINVNTATKILLLNIWNRKVDKIFINVCPESCLISWDYSPTVRYGCRVVGSLRRRSGEVPRPSSGGGDVKNNV
jgi:hypothetical protein